MKLAIVGSRGLNIDIAPYIPKEVDEIISGGAKGIDTCAEEYADKNHLSKHILRPNYAKYKKGAPLKRNEIIVRECDMLLVFWDGKSKGTRYTIEFAQKIGKEIQIVHIEK